MIYFIENVTSLQTFMNDLNNEAINMECVSTYRPCRGDATVQTITKRNKVDKQCLVMK